MYTLIITNTCRETLAEVDFTISGCEAAYAVFRKACELCELTGGCVYLTDSETAEILADNNEDDLDEDE